MNAPPTNPLRYADAIDALPVGSTILPIHARYEASCSEFDAIDDACGGEEAAGDKIKFDNAIAASLAEQNALRRAILFQVPGSYPEAMILAYHASEAYDLTINCDGVDRELQEAVDVALCTLFDYLCCETQQDHGVLGKRFQGAANRVFFQRRYRTGLLED